MPRKSAPSQESSQVYRRLPSVEEVLQLVAVEALAPRHSRELVLVFVRDVLESWRGEIKRGALTLDELDRRLASDALELAVAARAAQEERKGLRRAINATGVVLHTGLGRAPVHPEVADAMRAAAAGYCVLEVDRETGLRSERDQRLSELCVRLTGAEAAIAVNNNAAAVYLVLQTFAVPARSSGADGAREVIVSRGELVEIGGSFRIPDVMEKAGVVLREVGTTNRTRREDYDAAIGPRTALLMKVHTSNFRLQGFVHEVGASELATLAAEKKLPSAFDLGSGMLDAPGAAPLPGLDLEPRVRDAVASGVDVVTFSADKLLGGPQAGLVVGKAAAIASMRKNPVYRALRLDKVALAGLERTLELMLEGRGDELPARRMLRLDADAIRPRADALARAFGRVDGIRAEVVAAHSQPGSGSAPGVELPTFVVAVRHARLDAEHLAHRLRLGEPPVFARIQDERVLVDPRTLLEGDDAELARVFERLEPEPGCE